MSIIGLIASNNFIVVNKTLIREFGLECAVVLGALASQLEYFKEDLQDGFFYATVDRIKEDTGLSDYQQRQAVAKLQAAGIIETKVMGLPAKRFFRISEEALQNKFSKNCRTLTEKTEELVAEKLQGNKNIIIRKDIRNDSSPLISPPRGNAADAAVVEDVKHRINILFNRRESTAWSDKETKQLKTVAKREGVLDELTEIETLYNSGYQYRRRDVITFLNNFDVELDRARNKELPTYRGRPRNVDLDKYDI